MPDLLLEEVEAVTLSPPLVVQDDPAMRERLAYVLSTLGCDEPEIAWADNVSAARELLDAKHRRGGRAYGVVLVDVGLPGGGAVDLIGWMQAHHRQVPAVAVADRRMEQIVFAALRAGAIGYLLKENDDLELSIALRSIEQGGAPIDLTIARCILAWLGARPPASASAADDAPAPVALASHERKILELVSQGWRHHEMAESLSLSRLTLACLTKNIYRKLAVTAHAEAVA
jgi:DNA-binding NarL/FixJ family response regulator